MKSRNRKGLKCLLAVAAVAVIAVIVYFTSFHNADILKIEDGKVKGIKPTWLVGVSAESGEDTYVKLGDASAPTKDYKALSGAEDTDGDPVTTNFVFVGKKPEKNPGTVTVESYAWKPGVPEYDEGEMLSPGDGDATMIDPSGAETYAFYGTVKEVNAEDNRSSTTYIASPYTDVCIKVTATMPADSEWDEVRTLLYAAVQNVVPGKQVSPLAADFKLNFLDDSRWSYLLNGLLVTLEITLGAVLLGIVIGVIVATVRSTWDQNEDRMRDGIGKTILGFFNGICKVYLTVIRGTPVVIQLMIMYYIIFASSRNGVLIAMLAFGINSGAYVAEIIRGGIMSVDHGQLEAGRSLGFNYVQTMWHIIIPQAMKSVLPALANEFIVLLKETSVSGYVAVKDLTKGGDIIRGVTYSAFMPLIAVAIIYLIMVMFFTWLVGKLERRLRNSDH